jgi:acyl-CoA synthetase (AMP-forming)/AMP-acid ligase II
VLEAVGRFRVTRLALAPPALLAIVRTAEGNESVASSTATLQSVLCGGASLSPELVRRFSQKFPHACVTQVCLFFYSYRTEITSIVPMILPLHYFKTNEI